MSTTVASANGRVRSCRCAAAEAPTPGPVTGDVERRRAAVERHDRDVRSGRPGLRGHAVRRHAALADAGVVAA